MALLDGKVALISGAARGQGEAEARAFVAEGGSEFVLDGGWMFLASDRSSYATGAEFLADGGMLAGPLDS